MKSIVRSAILVLACACAATFAQAPDGAAPPEAQAPAQSAAPAGAGIVRVVVETSMGPIRLALEQARAPITTGNFLRYADEKRFDGTSIYRAMKLDEQGEYGLVQGGIQGDRGRALRPILHETTYATGLSHVDGAVSMAMSEPGTATGDFFFVVGNLTTLNGAPDGDPGYAVFGRVVEGMDLIRSILDLPRSEDAGSEDMKGQMLAEPVKILAVRRE